VHDREFLPAPVVARMEQLGGRDALTQRLTAIKQVIAAM